MSVTGKPVVLAIDDDTVILNTAVSILNAGYSIRPFTSGESALRFLETGSADLILLDNNMPSMSGFEVLERLRSSPNTCEIPVIVLTGSSDAEYEVQALEMGAVDYIQKPIKPQVLLTRVRLQVELQGHRRHLQSLVEEKTRHLNDAYCKLKTREDITLKLLARTADMRDHQTGGHIERTTAFVRIIVEHILAQPRDGYFLDPGRADDIVRSAKLHDLGKIATPDSILLKPGGLTCDEFEVIKQHPLWAEQILNECIQLHDDSFLEMAKSIAFGHHERWDGLGYPLGLQGAAIPLAARIVAIADVYDALVSIRPYKNSCTHGEAMEIIQGSSGTQFDPYLVDIFVRHSDKVEDIMRPTSVGVTEEYVEWIGREGAAL